MYEIRARKEVEKVLKKLAKKDKISSAYISRKIKEIKSESFTEKEGLRYFLINSLEISFLDYSSS